MTRLYLLIALALAGCGGDDNNTTPDAPPLDSLPPPRETIMENVLLQQSGESVEGIMTGGKSGDLAVIRLMGMAPANTFDWNIHGHADGGTQVIFTELDVTSTEYAFVPPSDGEWYLLVRYKGGQVSVQVKVELYGGLSWRWQ